MTISALRAVLPLVNVIGLMACIACSPNFCEIVALVTSGASCRHVSACQRKTSTAVIKSCFNPVAAVVARRAICPKSALVDVFGTMAADTIRLGLPVCRPRRMTVTACYGQVRSLQPKVGERVIERRFIQVDNAHFSSFVVRVTSRAFESLRFRKPAVKTGLTANVVPYFRVTPDA